MQMFLVGGCVRDEILGVSSKDIDFSVVLNNGDADGMDPFRFMVIALKSKGFKIFLETPEYLTVRAQFPSGTGDFNVNKTGGPINPGKKRLTADFVLARKESGYADGRRPDAVIPGTLLDDLARRDFTMNAIAKDSDGTLIDPFGGHSDIDHRIIRAVGCAFDRLTEDALRAVRALRFSVTKGFTIDPALAFAMENVSVLDKIRDNISDERIKDELSKMFRFSTLDSLAVLNSFPQLTRAMFAGTVSLDATMKTKGFNKPQPAPPNLNKGNVCTGFGGRRGE